MNKKSDTFGSSNTNATLLSRFGSHMHHLMVLRDCLRFFVSPCYAREFKFLDFLALFVPYEFQCPCGSLEVSDLVDVKILAYELRDRYADLLALKRDMKRYSKSKSTIDRGNFLRFLELNQLEIKMK